MHPLHPLLEDIFYYVNLVILVIGLLYAIIGFCRDVLRYRPPRGSHSAVGYDRVTVAALEGTSVEEAIVMPLTGDILPPLSARRLARYACDQREVGWEALVDEINKGAPYYPIIDELVCACADAVEVKVGGGFAEIEFKFEAAAEPWAIETVLRYVKLELQSKNDKFYLDTLMRCNEKDLLLLLQCFLEFYDQIDLPGVVTAR